MWALVHAMALVCAARESGKCTPRVPKVRRPLQVRPAKKGMCEPACVLDTGSEEAGIGRVIGGGKRQDGTWEGNSRKVTS